MGTKPLLVAKSHVNAGNPRLSVHRRGRVQWATVPLSRAENAASHAQAHPRIAPRRSPVRVRLAPLQERPACARHQVVCARARRIQISVRVPNGCPNEGRTCTRPLCGASFLLRIGPARHSQAQHPADKPPRPLDRPDAGASQAPRHERASADPAASRGNALGPYSDSPAASSALPRSEYTLKRTSDPSLNVHSWAVRRSTGTPLPTPMAVARTNTSTRS